MTRSAQRDSLDWLVSKFAYEVSGVSHAILVERVGAVVQSGRRSAHRA